MEQADDAGPYDRKSAPATDGVGAVPGIELLAGFTASPAVNAWIKDEGGRYLFVNDRVQRVFASPTRPMVGLTDEELFSPKVAAELREHDHRVLASGEALGFMEPVPDLEGETRCWLSLKFPIYGHQRRCVGGLGVDVTRYWQAERAQDQVRGIFEQVLDAITDMVFVKDRGSRLEWGNRAFCQAYGMSPTELSGLIDAPFNKPSITEQYLKDDRQVIESGRTLDIPEEPITCKDGKVLLVHTVKSPIFDRDGKVVKMVGVCRDITQRKAMEGELRQAQKLESLGRLASGIAHEINTPIQFVGDHATFVRDASQDLLELCGRYRAALAAAAAAGQIPPEALAELTEAEEGADLDYLREALPRAFSAIGDGVSRVARLVAAMKEFGHPDRDEKSEADLNRALRNTLTIVANELKYVAEVETDLGELPPVTCVVGELNQVFVNLLVNAAHAVADVRPARRGTIRVTSRQEGAEVVIRISDTGTGIPEAVRDRMFEPFFTTKEAGRGTGQGLALARMVVVSRHGGALTFETETGRGTTFVIRLPVRPEGREEDG